MALVTVKRAIVLVVSEKAEIVEANLERRFRSERAEYPYPLVIRLVKYVEIPRRLRKHVTNAILFARDNYRCQYCCKHRNDLGRRDRLTRDHVKPISRGGANTWDNVVTACTKCNAQKGQPPAHGMRHVPEEHTQRASLRRHGLVLTRPERGPTPLRGSVLRRPGDLIAVQHFSSFSSAMILRA